ncbi:protein kinase domain-containing protein [Yinghuangia sp. YIM S09857]|uniref:serine/threonine-protein kinase n=1 Tax=Yinghuangia sp. YIM S09857 TaxID=3436929 RepID=UPI003F53E407
MELLGSGDPQQVDRFRLVGVLGAGGMGRVFLGRAPDGAAVAVKVVHPYLLNGDRGEFRARFVREVQAARGVDTAFTARVVAADADAEVPWLATEFVPGIPLSEAVSRFGPLPQESLLALGAGLFAALAEIHAAGLVHRDVKPSNVMLGVDGPKVIDFGIARSAGATGLTRTGQTVGTMGFMSPEQFERSDVGPESDVFSAGAVLAYAATGHPPFPGDTLPVLFANLTTRNPDLAGLPTALAPLVEAALAKDPADRPAAATARTMLPAPPTHVGADHGWLPLAVTHAILRAAATALRTPGPAPDNGAQRAAPPAPNPGRQTATAARRSPQESNATPHNPDQPTWPPPRLPLGRSAVDLLCVARSDQPGPRRPKGPPRVPGWDGHRELGGFHSLRINPPRRRRAASAPTTARKEELNSGSDHGGRSHLRRIRSICDMTNDPWRPRLRADSVSVRERQ